MKVVINACFGGFGLSPVAVAKYLELRGDKCFFYKETQYSFREGKDLYEKTTIDKITSSYDISYTTTVDWGPSFEKWPKDDKGYFYDGDIDRSDPLLIRVVEELGPDMASGEHAELRIVEIPDGMEWEISEYDGREHIAETHRTWS